MIALELGSTEKRGSASRRIGKMVDKVEVDLVSHCKI
jgi:hypothetical protein